MTNIKWRVLVSAPYMQSEMERFRQILISEGVQVVVPEVNERLSEEELLKWISDVDGVICGDDQFTEKVLRAAPRLKVISKWGTGIDSIDQDTCNDLGIAVKNTPNAFSEPVADTVMGYILNFARKLSWMDRDMKNGIWSKIPGTSLREGIMGVIGVGNVGKVVVRRSIAFGMTVLGNDIVKMPDDFLTETGVKMVSKMELLEASDFVSVNCDLNPTSYHLMSAREFAAMKNTAFLINTARGPVIDEKCLIDALKEGLIAGAGLDVFEAEPLPENSPLLTMDNVMLAPHNANSSPVAWENVHENTIRNLLDVLKGGS